MAHTYSKLFSQIVGSTIWAEDHSTRIVWITLLALKDRFGEVNGTPIGLARIANVSLDECNAALAKFLAPEPSKHDDGRRIEEIEHGWYILNHEKYQRLASKEDSQQRNVERQRRFRKRHAVTVTPDNAPVTHHNATVTVNRDISDADAEAEVRITTTPTEVERPRASALAKAKPKAGRIPPTWRPNDAGRAFAADRGLDPDSTADAFADYWTANGGRTAAKIDWDAAFRTWCRRDAAGRVGGPSAKPLQASRGHGAFYDELASIARNSRDDDDDHR